MSESSKKIKVTICCGTYCYVMGGEELQQVKEILSPKLMQQIDFRYSTCLGYCKENNKKPPFAEVNGKCISEATIEKIIRGLETQIKEEGNGV